MRIITRRISSTRKVPLKTDPSRSRKVYKFKYFWSDTKKPVSPAIKEYVSKLKIPPNIDNSTVEIYWPKQSKILARWKDSKNRYQYLYNTDFIKKKSKDKFKRSSGIDKDFKKICKRLKDLYKKSKNTKVKNSALILYIIARTGFRIGSNRDTRGVSKAYGISTLLNKHVRMDNNCSPRKRNVTFDFIGKKGVRNYKSINDSWLCNQLKNYKKKEWSEPIFNVSDVFVRNVLNKVTRGKYQIKDFRTHLANKIALKEISKRKGPAKNERQFKKWQNEVADKVAKELGNTRKVTLEKYIDPRVWKPWYP